MHDSACLPITNIVHCGIRFVERSAPSPDVNPIEHILDRIGWALKNRQVPPRTIEELEAVVTEEWNQVTPDYP